MISDNHQHHTVFSSVLNILLLLIEYMYNNNIIIIIHIFNYLLFEVHTKPVFTVVVTFFHWSGKNTFAAAKYQPWWKDTIPNRFKKSIQSKCQLTSASLSSLSAGIDTAKSLSSWRFYNKFSQSIKQNQVLCNCSASFQLLTVRF